MSEKTLPKAKLDAAIVAVREYCALDFKEVTEHHREMAGHALDVCIEVTCGTGSGVSVFELLECVFRSHGIKPDATNEDIYKLLDWLGWQVVDDEQSDG